jgi:hypothetical protein
MLSGSAPHISVELNRRLNRAADKSYQTFLHEVNTERMTPREINNRFFHWQGGAHTNGEQLGLAITDVSRLKSVAKGRCVEFVQRTGGRQHTAEDAASIRGGRMQMWLAVYSEGTTHTSHVHDGSVCSGVYYSRGGDKSVPIVFSDPRGLPPLEMMMTNHELGADEIDTDVADGGPLPPFHNQYSFFAGDAGDIVLFPSWLTHWVPPQPTVDEHSNPRVAWVFNLVGAADSWSRTSG